MMIKKIIFIAAIIIVLALFVFLIFFSQRRCSVDSDCVINDCCEPTECVLKEKAPKCTSIVVCPTEPEQVNCRCIDGKCTK